jgi:hypothetical protein
LRPSVNYQQQAIRCLRLAQSVEYPDSKALLLEMAQAWVKMALQAREREVKGDGANQAASRSPWTLQSSEA